MAAVGARTDGERRPSECGCRFTPTCSDRGFSSRTSRRFLSRTGRPRPPVGIDERLVTGARTRKNYIQSESSTNYNATAHCHRFGWSPSGCCRRRYCRGITPHILFITDSSGVRSPRGQLIVISSSRGRLMARPSSLRTPNATRYRTDNTYCTYNPGQQPMTRPSHSHARSSNPDHTTPNGGVFA